MAQEVIKKFNDKTIVFKDSTISQTKTLNNGLSYNNENFIKAVDKFLQYFDKSLQSTIINYDSLTIILTDGSNIDINVDKEQAKIDPKNGIIYFNIDWFMNFDNYTNAGL